MTWDSFWYEDINRLPFYWQKHQFDVEARNQELWMQGIYMQEAIAAVLDTKHQVKYPDKPHRVTEMTDAEKQAENQHKVERMREQLMEIKRRSDRRRKGE